MAVPEQQVQTTGEGVAPSGNAPAAGGTKMADPASAGAVAAATGATSFINTILKAHFDRRAAQIAEANARAKEQRDLELSSLQAPLTMQAPGFGAQQGALANLAGNINRALL